MDRHLLNFDIIKKDYQLWIINLKKSFGDNSLFIFFSLKKSYKVQLFTKADLVRVCVWMMTKVNCLFKNDHFIKALMMIKGPALDGDTVYLLL